VPRLPARNRPLDFPTPVTGDEISGVITARDIGDSGDPPLYMLSGTTGDLTLSVEYTNLDGDIDVFTASNMRPLAKIGTTRSVNRAVSAR
jgi:hypothetical protein